MADEAEIHDNKLIGETYISSRAQTEQRPLRIASKVIDSEGLHYVAGKKEVVLRCTESGRTEIAAKLLEDNRGLTVATLQAFNGNTGNPRRNPSATAFTRLTSRLFTAVCSDDKKSLDFAEVRWQHLVGNNQRDVKVHARPVHLGRHRRLGSNEEL
jgi:hypothetical protein